LDLTHINCSWAGSFEWHCYFHWNGWTFCCTCSSDCPSGQVKLFFLVRFELQIVYLVYRYLLFASRYFTGHTYNPDGSVQYVKGKMGVGQTIRGVVRIFTVAVGIGFAVMYCFGVYLRISPLLCIRSPSWLWLFLKGYHWLSH
jgi:hypothetical protein